jgi:hypothetical protein
MLIALPSVALAQRGGGRRGGGGGRGGNSSSESSAIIPEPVNPVLLLIQHSGELALDTSQLRRVVAIKRSLDSTNTSFARRLDSLQDAIRRPTSGGERGAPLSRPRALIEQTSDSIRANIAPARDAAYQILSAEQLEKAQALEADADKTYQEQLKALLQPGPMRGGAPPE